MVRLMAPNLKRYRGLWVGISNNKVVSSGRDAKEVYKKAKKVSKKPIIFQVPTKEEEVCIL